MNPAERFALAKAVVSMESGLEGRNNGGVQEPLP